jgi:hypothetical protein
MKTQIKKSDKLAVPLNLPANTSTISVELSHMNFHGMRIHLSSANGRSITLPIHNKLTTGIRTGGFFTVGFEAFSVPEDLTITLSVN